MAERPSRGRGRARGISDVARKETANGSSTGSINDVISQLDALLLGGGDSSQIDLIFRQARNVVRTEDDLDEIASAICNACWANQMFIDIGSKLCCSFIPLEANGQHFKHVLLNLLQKEFEGRNERRADSPERFMNSIKFLHEIFIMFRDPQKKPFVVFARALICYLELLLEENALPEKIALFNEIYLDCGNELQQYAESSFNNLIPILREKILDDSISRTQRAQFLEHLELALLRFPATRKS